MTPEPNNEVTRLLEEVADGNAVSLDRLYGIVYDELRSIAAHKMASERPGHTLQATALVNEAYLRLGGNDGLQFNSRGHFFASAAEAMRRILVENARRQKQIKRGAGLRKVDYVETQIVAPAADENLLQVHEALDALAEEDRVKADVVKLRYFVGLKHQEIADALGLSEKTVRRHWGMAKVRLFELISEQRADRPRSAEAENR